MFIRVNFVDDARYSWCYFYIIIIIIIVIIIINISLPIVFLVCAYVEVPAVMQVFLQENAVNTK